MKKISFIVIILSLIVLSFSCGKVYENPIENYISTDNKKFRFNQNSFGLQYWSGVNWYPCIKEGDYESGYISFTGLEFEYFTNGDTVRLYEPSDVGLKVLKRTLILDKSQHNVFGIFQKK
jgi:hypothetical protein